MVINKGALEKVQQVGCAGAKEVVLLDREPCALQCALLAATANGFSCMNASTLSNTDFEVSALRSFQQALQISCSKPRQELVGGVHNKPTITASHFDWNVQPAASDFDVLAVCDVLYEEFSVEPLAKVLPCMLRPGAGQRVLLADPCRRTPQNFKHFMGMLASKRTDFIAVSSYVVRQDFEGGSVQVQLVNLKIREGGETVGTRLCDPSLVSEHQCLS
jgi:ETFB lysine methyltransferase